MKALKQSLPLIAGMLIMISCAAGFKDYGFVYSHVDTLVTSGTVQVINKDDGDKYVKELDASGKFLIEGNENDTVMIRIESPNFEPYEKVFVLQDGTPTIFKLDPTPTKIYGRVVDEKGNPVKGAIVATDISDALSQITDYNGQYELYLEGYENLLEIQDGSINVSASKIGYSSGSQWGKVLMAKSNLIPEIRLIKKQIVESDFEGAGTEELDNIPNGFQTPIENNEYDNTIEQFLTSTRNRTFTRSQFLDYMRARNKDTNLAEIDLNTLIEKGRVKQVGKNKYKVTK